MKTMGKYCYIVIVAVLTVNSLARMESRDTLDEGKGERRRNKRLKGRQGVNGWRNATSHRPSLDPVLAGEDTLGTDVPSDGDEVNFDKYIEDMVSQVRNNPALSKTKCVVDRQLWMSNSRSLSPWSYRINHDENRRPVDIPEAKCSCQGCINPFTMQEDRAMTSVLIYTKIPVRRLLCERSSRKPRKNKKCVPRYRTVVESIAVGCTCIVG